MNWWALRKDVHVSWLIAVACAGIVVGVITAQYLSGFGAMVWLLIGTALFGLCLWWRRLYILLFVFIAGGLIGLWRGAVTQQELSPYKAMIGHTITMTSTVSEDADLGKNGELVLRLNVQRIDGHATSGNVWVSTTTIDNIKRSDIVTMRGKLAEGFGSFVASMYQGKVMKVQRPQPGDIALHVRDEFADNVRLGIAEPEASLGIGYLVGQRRALPPELDNALQIAGLTHVVVASGYNLTILVRLARRLFEKVSKFMAAALAGGMIVAFVAVTGASPSMSRAGLVAGLSLLAWYYGRKFHPLVLLSFAAAVTLLVNPSFGWNDLGWQLSFAAFAGVMIVAPLTQRYFFGDEKPGTIRQILGETITAQVMTLPILVLAFGQFSNVAIVANLLVLPLVPLAMLLTFIAGVGATFLPAIAGFFGAPAGIVLQYMTTTAQYLAGLSWAQTQLMINGWIVAGYYAVVVVLCIYMWRKTKFNLRDSNIVE